MDHSAPDAPAAVPADDPGPPGDLEPPGDAGPAGWPSISDYWPDAPHRLGPAADTDHGHVPPAPGVQRDPARLMHRAEAETVPEPVVPDEPARRGWRRPVVAGAAAVVLLGGAGVVLAGLVRDDDAGPGPVIAGPIPLNPQPPAPSGEPVPVPVLPPETTPAPPPSSSPPAAGPARVTLVLVSSLARVTVRTRDTGDDLVRVRADDEVRPRFDRTSGVVRLTLTRDGRAVAADAEITLDDGVRWTVRSAGGAKEGVLDLTGMAPAAVELAGGGARIDVRLPAVDGVLPVRVADGVNRLRLHTPAAVPVRFRARAGAGPVDLYGTTRDGVARGGVVATPDRDARGRIDVDAAGGVGSLTAREVDR